MREKCIDIKVEEILERTCLCQTENNSMNFFNKEVVYGKVKSIFWNTFSRNKKYRIPVDTLIYNYLNELNCIPHKSIISGY